MSWYLRGDGYACCSCEVGCPCAAGGSVTLGSDGCCTLQIMDIHTGEVNGVDVGGVKVVAAVDWPGPMMAGNGTARLYFDVETSPQQQQAMETLLSGELGGVFADVPQLLATVLPPKMAAIRKATSPEGTAVITVGGFGEARVKAMESGNGEEIRLRGPVAFRDDVVLATGTGSWWRDPDLRQWDGGGYTEQSELDWNS